MIPDHLRIQPRQEALTPEQEAEARRFAEERIAEQLSTEPVDEAEAEALLKQAYRVAGQEGPKQTRWLDGPLQLAELFLPEQVWERWMQRRGERVAGRERGPLPFRFDHIWGHEWEKVRSQVVKRVDARVGYQVTSDVWKHVGIRVQAGIWASMRDRVDIPTRRRWPSPWDGVWGKVWEPMTAIAYAIGQAHNEGYPKERGWEWDHDERGDALEDMRSASIVAYSAAPWLARDRFFDEYLEPNDLHALAHFNELVSGYWLGHDLALLLRRPHRLERDAAGRLHSATGKCVEYRDGWGFYAWHGVQTPECVILAPETLTRKDFLGERNVEMRRIIQERMGQRFVAELGGVILHRDSRGILYEVALPDDPERVARYVQVQDASTSREYFLRVPPTIQTAAEAVAWTFQVAGDDYRPAEETRAEVGCTLFH